MASNPGRVSPLDGGDIPPPQAPLPRPKRLPLGRARNRLSYERRIRLWLMAFFFPSLALAAGLAHLLTGSASLAAAAALALAFLGWIAGALFFDQLIRPLQTLANVVAALREDDFSFRARGARRGDALGDLALEINALASTLQTQRHAARDALALFERIMSSMPSPVLAFTPDGRLRLLNDAAERALQLTRHAAVGRFAADLGLAPLVQAADEDLYTHKPPSASQISPSTRWSVRTASFRLHGAPHILLVLSDVASALREEERVAWQRLIRVLSHEINNSLTPIKSIAGSLRVRVPELDAAPITSRQRHDFHRGLTVIEERAASLNRFLQAYQQLTRLPPPQFQRVPLQRLLAQLIPLETRLPVTIQPGPDLDLLADPDQLEQLLINLLRNAVDAALDPGRNPRLEPTVRICWSVHPQHVLIHISDNGPGLTNPANLFVPFYTTKPNGSGIGLVLAQQIASAHRGSVSLANRDGATGCIAELRLPLELGG